MTKIAKTAPHRCAALFLPVKVLLKSILQPGWRIRYFLTISATLKTIASSKLAQIRPVSLLESSPDGRPACCGGRTARGDVSETFRLFSKNRWMVNSVSWHRGSRCEPVLNTSRRNSLAEGGRQLIDQAGNAQIVVADDLVRSVSNTLPTSRAICASLKELEARSLMPPTRRADADNRLDIVLALQSVDDGAPPAFPYRVVSMPGLISLTRTVSVSLMLKTKSFCLSGKRLLDDIVGGNIVAGAITRISSTTRLHVGD